MTYLIQYAYLTPFALLTGWAFGMFDHQRAAMPTGHDDDGDGYGNITDCVDYNGEINPGAQEICDGVDNNCDGLIDAEDYDAILTDYCLDGNHDGRCDKTANDGVHVISACTMPDNATLQAIVAMSGGDAKRIDSYIKVPDEGDSASVF